MPKVPNRKVVKRKGFFTDEELSLSEEKSNSRAPRSVKKTMRPLPTDRIAFDKQLNLLRAFAVASGSNRNPVTNSDVSKFAKMAASTVSQSNAFFVDIGLLTREKEGFVPASDVFSYARSFKFDERAASLKLGPILSATWFAECLLPRVEFRDITLDEAMADLADEVHATHEHKPQLEMLIQYLETAGLIFRDGNSLLAGEVGDEIDKPDETEETDDPPMAGKSVDNSSNSVGQTNPGAIDFNIHISVDMTELSQWDASRITAFFDGLGKVVAAKKGLTVANEGKLEEKK